MIQKMLHWKEPLNEHQIECLVEIAIHPSDSNTILLIVPGADGSLDGHNNKYLNIATSIQTTSLISVVRMSNPFIHSERLDRPLRFLLNWIEENIKEITLNNNSYQIFAMGHSLGASILAQIAWEYPEISKVLLINPATKVGLRKICSGLKKFQGEATILVGDKDPSFTEIKSAIQEENHLTKVDLVVATGADHHFKGESFETFLLAPKKYLVG